jgi:hypothetical protein
MDLARVEEDALGERRLPRVDVGGDSDVADLVERDGHDELFLQGARVRVVRARSLVKFEAFASAKTVG